MKIVIKKAIYDLFKTDDGGFKTCYEADYKTVQEKTDHVHRKMYSLCGTETIGAIVYPVMQLSTLRTAGYTKLLEFLFKNFNAAGVRPDTPFHANDEGKYTADALDSYRYMEFNTIGGGMRLVFDATTNDIFLSAHYSDPAVLRATGGADGGDLDTLAAAFLRTHTRIKRHSDGTMYTGLNTGSDLVQANRREQAALYARQSPAFIAWLQNKNSRQEARTVRDWYNVIV